MKQIIVLSIIALLLSACSTQPRHSAASSAKKTKTGIPFKSSPVGRAIEPSVQYVRVELQEGIFLDAAKNDKIYVRIKDTSSRDWETNVEKLITTRLKNNGFKIVGSSKDADYYLQANILLAQGVSAAELAQIDETQYGQSISEIATIALGGAAVGAIGGGLLGGSGYAAGAAAAGAVVGGLLSYQKKREKEQLIQSQQETKFFSVIVDIKINERITQLTTNSRDLSGESDNKTITWKKHQGRITGKSKAKLIVFKDVEYEFATKIAKSISGIF